MVKSVENSARDNTAGSGRNDGAGAAWEWVSLAVGRECEAPGRSVADHDCNGLTMTAEFFADAPRSTG